MATAKETVVSNLLSVETCSHKDCTCGNVSEHETDYIRIGNVRVEDSGMETTLYASPEFGSETPISIPGVKRAKDVLEAFNNCEGPVRLSSGEVVCGAILALRDRE